MLSPWLGGQRMVLFLGFRPPNEIVEEVGKGAQKHPGTSLMTLKDKEDTEEDKKE